MSNKITKEQYDSLFSDLISKREYENIIELIHCQNHGHKVLPLLGDATAMIGDPSGKSEGRNMLGISDIFLNSHGVKQQIADILHNKSTSANFSLVCNSTWTKDVKFVDMLREVGSKLSVNKMLSMDSVKNRIDSESGISFLEFSYMLLQANDFLHLARTEKCFIQIGGPDQWGNIVMGIELARKSDGLDLAGITLPLVTKSDGTKFGKSETGNIWLSADKTSVFDFWQFWRNTRDEDVKKFLKMFTFLFLEEIDELVNNDINNAKVILAMEVTSLVHGHARAEAAQEAAKALFKSGGSFDAIPSKKMPEQTDLLSLLMESGFAASRTKARRMVDDGGVKINGAKQTAWDAVIDPSCGILLQFGKKAFKFTI